jgi:DNA-binding response OmpR family regulator
LPPACVQGLGEKRHSLSLPASSMEASPTGTGDALLVEMEKALKILAIDNEPSVTATLACLFNAPRYQVTAAANGDDALARIDAGSDQFDVIIVDQKMPHLTGAEFVAAMRERGMKGKIIVLSANLSGEVRAAYEQMDVDIMFTKPFDIAELRAAVENAATCPAA